MRIRFGLAGCILLSMTAMVLAETPATAPASQPAARVGQFAPKGVKVERNIEYVPGGGAAQSLDMYLPETPSEKPLPLIVWIHGGGWHAGSKDGCPAAYLVPQGYVVASVEYRFSQKAIFPAQIQDCQAAIRFLRANSKKFNFDTSHVGVWGASAGGHLVSLLGTSGGKKAFEMIGGSEAESDRVQAVVDWFGPKNFNSVMKQAEEDKNVKSTIKWNAKGDPYSELIGVKLGENVEKELAVSPIKYVSTETPPFLIMHGTADALVPYAQSEEFIQALNKSGVKVNLQTFKGAGHGGPAFNQPGVKELITAFFDKNLKGMDVKVETLPEEPAAKPAASK